MIRLRKSDGSSIDIKQNEIPFVEIINDLDGTIGKLLIQVEPGKLLEVYPNGADAQRYAALMRAHGVKFSEMIIHRK